MAVIQLGTPLVWATNGVTFTGSGVYATGKVMSVGYTLDGEWTEVRGQLGAVLTVVIPDSVETVECEVIPTGASLAAAVAANVLPARGAAVTFTDTDDAENSSGRIFYFKSGSKAKSNTDKSTLKMTLVRYDDANMSAF
jgi:hypothetical protein